jgi:hypothetical protein
MNQKRETEKQQKKEFQAKLERWCKKISAEEQPSSIDTPFAARAKVKYKGEQ